MIVKRLLPSGLNAACHLAVETHQAGQVIEFGAGEYFRMQSKHLLQ
jgi:hypothetical protein